jgi:glycosyltransferase involved in cell wall biosynthesis
VPPEDPNALAGALRELLVDRSAREALADGATAAAATTYSWDRIGEATMALYRDLLDKRR